MNEGYRPIDSTLRSNGFRLQVIKTEQLDSVEHILRVLFTVLMQNSLYEKLYARENSAVRGPDAGSGLPIPVLNPLLMETT